MTNQNLTDQNTLAARQFHEVHQAGLHQPPQQAAPVQVLSRTCPTIPLPGDNLALETPALPSVAGQPSSPRGDVGPEHPGAAALLFLRRHPQGAGCGRRARSTTGPPHPPGRFTPPRLTPFAPACRGWTQGSITSLPNRSRCGSCGRATTGVILADAAGGDAAIAGAPVTIVFTSVFWRSSWKYRSRGYRYCHWDNGTVAANLLSAATAASGLPGKVVLGFVDHEVDRLIGADSHQEASICLVPVGTHREAARPRGTPHRRGRYTRQPNFGFPGRGGSTRTFKRNPRRHPADPTRRTPKPGRGGCPPGTPQPVERVYPLEPHSPGPLTTPQSGWER